MSILEWWKQLGRARQTGFGVGAALIVGLVAVLAYFVFRDQYIPLLQDRESMDAGSVIAELDGAHADYRLDSVSGRVMVPESSYPKLRALLQQRGLSTKTQAGFEVFDHSEFGMTDFAEKINYQRALEGEIARTLTGLDSIRSARVHLVLPDSSLFRRDKDAAKAAVTISVDPGKSLSADRIQGIQKLVASAVPGLTDDHVSVMDETGAELTASDDRDAGQEGAVQRRLRAKSIVEDYLSDKLYHELAPLFPGRSVIISADAELDMDQVASTRDAVLPAPQGGIAVSRLRTSPVKSTPTQVMEQAEDGETPKPVATPGSPAQFDVEYQIGHVHDQVQESPGRLKRLSVAVVVPTASDLQMDHLKELVAAVVGADPARGDFISVVSDASLDVAHSTTTSRGAESGAAVFPPTAGSMTLLDLVKSPLGKGIAALLALFLLTGLLVGARLRKPPVEMPRLSSTEREQLLAQIREWLQHEDPLKGEVP